MDSIEHCMTPALTISFYILIATILVFVLTMNERVHFSISDRPRLGWGFGKWLWLGQWFVKSAQLTFIIENTVQCQHQYMVVASQSLIISSPVAYHRNEGMSKVYSDA